jgi:ribosomal protein S18 acetylase RimI-like enzyme
VTTTNRQVVIERASEVTPQLVEDVARLIPQVSSTSPAPTGSILEEIVSNPLSRLFVARLAPAAGDEGDGPVVGMLTLAAYRVPTGLHAVIEDVVVDENARGAGAGGALVQAALAEADRLGAKHVDLTSRPSRDAANRLYLRMGFTVRETNIYRHSSS